MADIIRISSEDAPAWQAAAGGNGRGASADLKALGDHLTAARAIVDLAAAAAEQLEREDNQLVDPATMRRALREALRHLEQAEEIAMDLPGASA